MGLGQLPCVQGISGLGLRKQCFHHSRHCPGGREGETYVPRENHKRVAREFLQRLMLNFTYGQCSMKMTPKWPTLFLATAVSCSVCTGLKGWKVLSHDTHHGRGSAVKESKHLRTVIKRGIANFLNTQGGIFNSRQINLSMSLSLICINTIIDSLLTVH